MRPLAALVRMTTWRRWCSDKENGGDSPHRSPLGCVEVVSVEAMVILSLPALTVNGRK